jgi:hypothetical protein
MKAPPFSVVALIDALGFKDIEKRMAPELAIEAMKIARASMARTTAWFKGAGSFEHHHQLGDKPIIKLSWFSDTICTVVSPPDDQPREVIDLRTGTIQENVMRGLDDYGKAALVDIAGVCIGSFLRAAAESALPFAFRGVITVGEAIVEDENIYIGAAFSEAAELYEAADGAFVWLSPSASNIHVNRVGRRHGGFVRYPVPLKGGRIIDALVVSPYIDTLPTSDAGQKIRDGIAQAMAGDRLDIVVKRQNTMAFLDHVAATDSGAVRREPATT